MKFGRLATHHYGWLMVVVSSLIMSIGFGSLISVSVFLKPLEAEFGWDRGLTSFAYSCASFMNGVMGIAVGRLVDRLPARPIVLTGALVLGASQILLSRIDSIWALYLIYGTMVGGLGNGCLLIPLMTNVGFWMERHKGVAMAAVLAGQSLGGALVPYFARTLISGLDWRDAYLVMGLTAWGVLIPLALLVRPPSGPASARASQREDFRPPVPISPGRLTAVLSAAIVCCCVCMAIPVIHVYPLALEAGLAPQAAAAVLSVLMVTSIAGRLGLGRIADSIGGIRSLLVASGIQTVMIFWFSQSATLAGLLAIAVAFGIGYGGVIPSYAVIIRELIPPHRVGAALGMVFFFGNIGMSSGGYLGGLLHHLSGSYQVSYGVGVLAGMANLAIVSVLLFHIRGRGATAAVPA